MPARTQPPPQPAALLPASSAHTSGIFSDMTVDGVEIGTLVVVVDRARHLPNLRTMGKQDPYCAARLGKEAKKTETDKRGGQTPRWDQELRFTVRDGADYNRLKVSVFNDDRKTDLVGETWVMLDSLLLPGGGQGDSWHTLTCKGKYAGEIRIELTYYDTRPKEPRQRQSRPRESLEAPATSTAHTVGPRELPQVKRRPLPTPGISEQSHSMPQLPATAGVPMPSAPARSYHTPPRRLSEQPVYEEPEEEEEHESFVSEMEPDVYTQHPTALASYASTSTNPYHSSPNNDYSPHELQASEPYEQAQSSYDEHSYHEDHYRQQPEGDAYQPPQFMPLRNDRVDALSHTPPRPLPPVGLPHSNSAPDAVHYVETGDDYHRQDQQYIDTPMHQQPQQQQPAYSSPVYEPSYVDHLDRRAPLPAPPGHRNSMPAHFRPAPVHYSSEPNWPSAAQAAPMPQEPQMAFDPTSLHQPPHRHSYVAPPPQPLHHASYPGYSKPGHQEQVMVHQPQPRYPEQRAFHSSPTPAHQHTYSVPDFSRNYGGQPASTAALRAPQSQARGRPVSMVETPTPAYNNSQQLNPAQPSLGGPSTPRRVLRKSVSPHPAPQTSGTHYSPDSFNTYNTHTSRPTANADTSPSGLREPSPMYTASMPVPESSPDPPASTTRTTPDGRILTSSGKVVDPSDHIPSTSWAPEPEPKGARPSVAIHIKNRFGPREARSLPPSPGATSPAASSPASVGPSPLAGASMRPRHSTLASPIVPSPLPQSNSHPGRNRLQKRIPSNPLAESAPGTLNAAYRAPRAAGAPPIPPKLPLGYANGEFAPANEPFNDALSQEMSLIDIGPKEDSGRRRGLFGRKKKVDEYS